MFEKLSNKLYAIFSPNAGSNAFLLIGEKTALIDPGLEHNTQYLLQTLSDLGFEAKDIDLLLFSHGHADHFSASKPFKKSETFMHQFDAEYVKIKDALFTASAMLETSYFPKITGFIDELHSISLKPFSLEVISTPGHTAGSVCFYEPEEKLLFSGDTLFNAGRGRNDLLSGSAAEMRDSLKKLLELDFNTLLPGHGPCLYKNQKSNIKTALKTFSGAYLSAF